MNKFMTQGQREAELERLKLLVSRMGHSDFLVSCIIQDNNTPEKERVQTLPILSGELRDQLHTYFVNWANSRRKMLAEGLR